jgi:TonB family protein
MKNPARKPESFIKHPVYPGGKKALDDFIKANLKYPDDALENKVEGSVTLEYDVDVFGKVIAVRVKHGIGYGCDEEAIRLVSLLKYPKRKYQGLRVVFHMNIHIHFRLHTASKPADKEQKIVYSVVESKKATNPTHSYTVNLQPEIKRKN